MNNIFKNFNDLFIRADEYTLQQMLGGSTLRMLTTIDKSNSYNKKLRSLILEHYGPEGILLNKKLRGLLLDLLKESEAKLLCQLLGIQNVESVSTLYEKLKQHPFRRGSKAEEKLFRFFNLVPSVKKENVFEQLSESSVEQQCGYKLFEHQRVAARKVHQVLNTYPFRVLLHMPTGSGKTRTAMNIIADHLRNFEPTLVIWLANSEELCEQAVEEFKRAWTHLGNRSITVHRFWDHYSMDVTRVNDGLVVAGMQKMNNAIKGYGGIEFISTLGKKCSLVIMDEAHQAVAPTYSRILEILCNVGSLGGNNTKLLGLSATPGRSYDDRDVDAILAGFFSRKKVKLEVKGYDNPVDYLTEEGYLAKVNYRQLLHKPGEITNKDLQVIANASEIPLDVLRKFGQDEQRNLKIVYEIEKLVERHKRIILFAPSVESSNLLAFVLKAIGYQAFSLTGETNHNLRKGIIENFKNNDKESKVLCNYGVLTTGFDAPKTSAAIIARPTLSLVLYSQMVGRAIRGGRAGGNDEAEIVTIIDQGLPGFSAVADAFHNWEDVWT